MSWLYTVIFSGLALAGSADRAPVQPADVVSTPPAAVANASSEETERFEQSYPLSANGRVSVSNLNGSIEIKAWDKNEVKLVAVKTADSRDSLDSVKIKVDSKADWFSVEADYGDWKFNGRSWDKNRRVDVQFDLMVPRGAVLNEIETVNGSVTVSNMTNSTRVSAVNGNIKAVNLRGAANISTVNGEVSCVFSELDGTSRVSLSTVNGGVSLTIPSDSNATVKADSVNGNISNDFNLPVRKGKYVGRDLYGKLGAGGVTIKLDSVNGDLRIGRAGDGKSLSPAVDLLPQKSRVDEDWDNEDGEDRNDESRRDAAAAREERRAQARAAREAQVEVRAATAAAARAQADAAREIAKIRPVIVDKKAIEKALESIDNAEMQRAIAVAPRIAQEALAEQKLALAAMADARMFMTAPRIERKSNIFTVEGNPKVTIDAKGCSVRIVGSDSPTVKYSLTDMADHRSAPKVNVIEKTTSKSIDLKVEGADDEQHLRTRIEVTVPRKSDIRVITDGEIRIDGVTGTLDVQGGDGTVNIRDIGGKLDVKTASGDIRLIGFKGELSASSDSGDLSLEGDFNAINASSSDGSVTVTVPADTRASIDTAGTDVIFEGLAEVDSTGAEGQKKYTLNGGGARYQVRSDQAVVVRSSSSLLKGF